MCVYLLSVDGVEHGKRIGEPVMSQMNATTLFGSGDVVTCFELAIGL